MLFRDHKARVDVVNRNGLTPLHHSAGYCNRLEFVKEMVGLSAKLDLLTAYQKIAPIHIAANKNLY